MKDILFRGKRVDNGEWVVGAALPHDNSGEITIFRQNPGDGALEGFEAVPETVGQATGLTDKNGNKIFEGDIVHYYCSDVTALVKFGFYVDIDVNKEAYGFYSEYKESEIGGSSEKLVQEVIDHRESDEEYGCEVIGNVYDNPELLEM